MSPSTETSPAHSPTPLAWESEPTPSTVASDDEEFGDPFVGEWEMRIMAIDMETMVDARDLQDQGGAELGETEGLQGSKWEI